MADATGAPSPSIAPLTDKLEPDMASWAKDLAAGAGAWDFGAGDSVTTGPEARARVAVGLPGRSWVGAEAFANDHDGQFDAGIWAGIGGHF